MILVSFGPMYVGIDKESFWDMWRTSAALHVHLGTVSIEWDCRQRHNGPAQKTTHRSTGRPTA